MRERERVLLCRNDEKGHGGRAGEQGIQEFSELSYERAFVRKLYRRGARKKIEKGMPGNRSTSVHHSANDGSPRHGIILIHL